MAYFYPTEDGVKFAMESGWTREQAKRGFEIFDYDGSGLLEIECIGDAYVEKREDGHYYSTYFDDEEAAKEAERIGFCKIIPVDELPNPFIINENNCRWFGWVDTPENRKNIEKWCKEYNE